MSYFLARYLYRKWKNRGGAPGPEALGEEEPQQVTPSEHQLATANGADIINRPDNSDATLHEKAPRSEHQQVSDKKHKQVPLCEHQLAAVNGADGVNGDPLLQEKDPSSEYQSIPDEKRLSCNFTIPLLY